MNSQPPLNASPQDREAALFEMALEKTGTERQAFLQAIQAEDRGLHSRLRALLAAHEQEDSVLASPAEPIRRSQRAVFPDTSPDEAVGQTIGRYKLLECLGEGGCGVVYVAEQLEPVRRRVALKVIKLGMDTRAVVARFEAERQALALMDHPNIAKVFDAGSTETGRPFFVMELVRGIKITDYCDQKSLSTEQRLELFIQACHAIQHAHQKGIIHRDIKPSNILVTLQDGVAVPKVIDFGIAKATEGRLTDPTVYTQLNQLLGTPAYMSPEQAEMTSADVDTRSDIYSLGVLLYELLTGKTPFDPKELLSEGIDAMRRRIQETEPVRPSTRLATLKPEELTTTAQRRSLEAPKLIWLLKGDLDWVAMKCLEKDRVRRYACANGLAMDLQRYLDQEPVIARPPSRLYHTLKWVRRNKLVFVSVSAVILALVTGLGIAGAVLRERRARKELTAVLHEQACERAMVAATGGDFVALKRALEDASRQGVSDAQLLMLHGLYYLFSNKSQEAVQPLQQAVQRMPQNVAARALLTSAYKDIDFTRYEEQLGLLGPMQPITWEDHLFKGEALRMVDAKLQLELVDRAIELKRNSPLARTIRADARIEQAMNTHDLATMKSALEDLEVARQFFPPENLLLASKFTWAHMNAARLFGEKGHVAEQQQHLQETEKWGKRLEQFPACEAAVAERAIQLETCGHEDEALKYIQNVLAQQRYPSLLRRWAHALYRKGQVAEAHKVYAEIRQENPGLEYMRLIAWIELAGAKRARAELDEFYAKYSGGVVQLVSPDMYNFAGLTDEARRRGQANHARRPTRVKFFSAHYDRIARFHAGLLDENALVEASQGSSRNLVSIHTSLGLLHLSDGDRAGAKDHFHKSVRTGRIDYAYYQIARNLLARMEADSSWPPWIPMKSPAAVAHGTSTTK